MMNSTIALLVLLTPAVAMAAPDAAASGSPGVSGLITAIAALIASITALIAAISGIMKSRKAQASAAGAAKKAASAEERSTQAMDWADRIANAHSDGVVLLLSYPGTVTPCRGLLEVNGWKIQHYQVTQAELDQGVLLPGPHMIEDICAADAIVVEGLDVSNMDRLAGIRLFRDNIRSGAGVALYTGGSNYRYNLTLWGECDQGVTMPVTCEAAVRASLARREATARRQGIRPGQLAAARQELLQRSV